MENVEIFIQFPHYGNFLVDKLNAAETIQEGKQFEGGNYLRKYRIYYSCLKLLNPIDITGNNDTIVLGYKLGGIIPWTGKTLSPRELSFE